MRPARPLEERFWPKVDVRGPDDCWPWTAAKNDKGYGVLRPVGRVSGPAARAHRVSYELKYGHPPKGVLRHTCDNRPCVNPAHLIDGTHAENVQDMVDRDRQPRGERNGMTTLTAEVVLAIRERRAAGESGKTLAAEYGITQQSVCNIVKRRSWAHV